MFRKPNILLLRKELAKVGQNGNGFHFDIHVGKGYGRKNRFCRKTRTLESIVASQVPNSISPRSRVGTKQMRLLLRIILLDCTQTRFGGRSHFGNARTLDFLRFDRNLCQRTLNCHFLSRVQSRRFLGNILGQRSILVVGIQSLGSAFTSTTQGHGLRQLRHNSIADIRRTRTSTIGFSRVGTQHRSRRSKGNLLSFPLRTHCRALDLELLHDNLLQGSLVVGIHVVFTTIQLGIDHLFRRLCGSRLVDVSVEIHNI